MKLKLGKFGKEEIIMLVLALGLSVFLVEKSIQSMFMNDQYVWIPYTEAEFYPRPNIFPGVEGDAIVRINSKGFRGSYPPNEHLIVTLGGGATECLFLNQNETWQGIMERYLNRNVANYSVWNAGKSGKTTFEHLEDLPKILDSLPNLETLIIMPGIEDLNRIMVGDYSSYDKPWYQKTYIYKGASKFNNRFERETEKTDYDIAGSVVINWRDNRQSAKEWRNTIPNFEKLKSLYFNNIKAIIKECKKYDIELIMVAPPALWYNELTENELKMLWMGGVGDYKNTPSAYYTEVSMQQALFSLNNGLEEVCKNENTKIVRLDQFIPPSMSYFYDDCHFNELGSYEVAKVILRSME